MSDNLAVDLKAPEPPRVIPEMAVPVLRSARAKLASGRWTKGQGHDDNGNACALGAVWDAQYETGLLNSGADCFLDSITAKNFGRSTELFRATAEYNDRESTTLEDVLALFDKALAELGAL